MSMRTGHPRTIELVGGRKIKRQVTRIHYIGGNTFGHIQMGGVDTIVQAYTMSTITGENIHWSKADWYIVHPEYYEALRNQ